jgi:predicted amidophosphoribosyltransferase
MLFPTRCPACRRRGPAPCPACAAQLRPARPLPPPLGVSRCHAVLAYEGVGRELVARLKYRNERSALARLALAMAALVAAPGLGGAGEEAGGTGIDLVTWVPTSPARRRQRGFDQAELLARAVARRLRLPCPRAPVLARRPGPPQTGRPAAERRAGGPAFVARRVVAGLTVLLVDDVVTTGATMSAAAIALRTAGAADVIAVAAARTPLKARRLAADTARDGPPTTAAARGP